MYGLMLKYLLPTLLLSISSIHPQFSARGSAPGFSRPGPTTASRRRIFEPFHIAHTLAMAPMDRCLASMARLSLVQAARPALPTIPRFLAPSLVHSQQTRHASVIRIKKKAKKTRVVPKDYRRHKLEKYEFPQFSLVEAMRYVLFLPTISLDARAGKPTSKTRQGKLTRGVHF